jgi:superfamily II DNA/RNA helicase
MFIKLDKDLKIPETLKMEFFLVRNEDKNPILMYILREKCARMQGIIFVSTKHHVEYLELVT